MATTKTKTDTPRSITAPIEILPSAFARVYTHVHPILALGLLYATLPSMINDPVGTLLSNLPYLSLLQITYLVACLPPASVMRPQATPQSTPRSSHLQPRRKTTSPQSAASSPLRPACLAQVLAVSVAAPVIFALILLHGAPLNSHLAHTALCAGHMAVLATSPLFYTHGVSSTKWRELCGFMAPMDEVIGAAVGTIVGAWLGAIPIPLDWDRDWQKWPVTIIVGAYAGHAVGKFIGGTVFKGKVFGFEQEKGEEEFEEMRLAIQSEEKQK